MPAEWHFFATSDGNGPCDGVGATVNSLTRPGTRNRVLNLQPSKAILWHDTMAHGGWRAPRKQCRTLEKLKYDSDIHMVQQDLSNTLLKVDVLIMSYQHIY